MKYSVANGLGGRVFLLASVMFVAGCGPVVLGSGGPGKSNSSAAGTTAVPTAFSFANANNVALSTTITSAMVTLAGITAPMAISITGGQYQIGSGSWTSAAGQVSNGQTVRVQQTTSAQNGTSTVTTLTVGGFRTTFTSVTVGACIVPTVVSGGLTVTQDNVNPATTWQAANSYCTNTTINGQTGWRLPSTTELTLLRTGNTGVGLGWALVATWASDAASAGFHNVVVMSGGNTGGVATADSSAVNFSCVHT